MKLRHLYRTQRRARADLRAVKGGPQAVGELLLYRKAWKIGGKLFR